MEQAFFLVFAVIIFLGLYDRIVYDNWISVEFHEAVLTTVDRGNFSTVYLVAFSFDLFAVVWLLGPGMASQHKPIAWIAHLMHRVFTFRPLVFLGQHSLHVFSAHILCVYLLAAILNGTRPSPVVANLLILISPIPLFVAAWGHKALQSGSKVVSAPRGG